MILMLSSVIHLWINELFKSDSPFTFRKLMFIFDASAVLMNPIIIHIGVTLVIMVKVHTKKFRIKVRFCFEGNDIHLGFFVFPLSIF